MGLLRNRTIAALAAARLISLTGSSMTVVALPWFVLVTSHSSARTGIVLAAQLLPVALLGIPSGSVLAALGPRRTMIVADFARAPLMAAVPILHRAGLLSFPLLVALAFVFGAFRAPYGAALNALMPELAGEDEALVSRANALFQVVTQGTTIFGPVLAGVLIGATSAPTVLVADAASFLASGVIVATLVRAGERVEAEPSAHGVLAGLRFVLREPLLGPLVLAAIAMSLAHQALSGMLPVLAFERYGRATSAGVVFAADGVGSVLGSLLVIGLAGRVPTARLLRVAVAVMAAALWPLPFALPLAAIAASMFVFGFGSMLFVPPLVSVITLRSPASLRGKVMTSYVTVMMLAGPAGIALAGPSVQAFGLEPVFLGVATVFAVGAVGVSVVVRGASRSSPTPDPRCRSARGHRAVRRRGSCPPAHPRPTRPGTP